MNLPNKITLSRIFIVPVFMLFAIPFPDWLVNDSIIGRLLPQLQVINNFTKSYGQFIAAAIFVIAASTDGVDGYIARKRKLITKFGIFLDPIADKLLVNAALIALVERHVISGWVAMIILSRELLVTGFRLVAAGENIVIPASKWGKIKTVTQIIAITLCLLKNYPLSEITDFRFDWCAMLIAVIVTIYSGYEYLAKNVKLLND